MGCRRKGPAVVALAAACAIVPLRPSVAEACSIAAPPPALVGSPSDGDTNVPTDVVPFYDSSLAQLPLTATTGASSFTVGGNPQFKLVSAGGDEIPLTASATHYWAVELTPQGPLQPNTSYTLNGAWTINSSTPATGALTFTTGAGPVLARPPAPKASLERYHWNAGPTFTDCDPSPDGACVALPENAVIEVTYIDSFGQDNPPSYLYRHSYLDTGLNPSNTNFSCLRLRERAPNGTFGDPTVLCAADAPLVSFGGSAPFECTSEGLTRDGQPIPELPTPAGASSGGGAHACSLAGGGGAGTAPLETLFVLSVVLATGVRIGSRRRAPPS